LIELGHLPPELRFLGEVAATETETDGMTLSAMEKYRIVLAPSNAIAATEESSPPFGN
jgi:hypothetical protein